LLFIGATLAPVAASTSSIAVFSDSAESILRDASLPIWDREEGVVIASVSSSQLDALKSQGIEPIFTAPDNGEAIHILSYDRYFTPPVFPGVARFAINGQTMLYLIPAGLPIRPAEAQAARVISWRASHPGPTPQRPRRRCRSHTGHMGQVVSIGKGIGTR